MSKEIADMLKTLHDTSNGIDNFVVYSNLTAILDVGAQIKVTGYAASKKGFIIKDNTTVTIEHGPYPELEGFESSYYIIAEEGLTFNLHTEYP